MYTTPLVYFYFTITWYLREGSQSSPSSAYSLIDTPFQGPVTGDFPGSVPGTLSVFRRRAYTGLPIFPQELGQGLECLPGL